MVGVLEIARRQTGGPPELHREDRGALRGLERLAHAEIRGQRQRRQQFGTPQRRITAGQSYEWSTRGHAR